MSIEALLGVIGVVNVLAIGAVGWVLSSLKSGTEEAAKKQAEEIITRLNWDAALQRVLQQARAEQRQELRFKFYAALWAKIGPLAIYDNGPTTSKDLADLSKDLTCWYFSQDGGLMLTSYLRHIYFALQDLARAAGSSAAWEADREAVTAKWMKRQLTDRKLALRKFTWVTA